MPVRFTGAQNNVAFSTFFKRKLMRTELLLAIAKELIAAGTVSFNLDACLAQGN